MKRLALAVAILASACSFASAQECVAPDKRAAEVASYIPGTTNFTIGGQEAANFVFNYNAEPPQTDVKADRLVVLQNDKIGAVYVLMVLGNCVVEEVQIPKQYFPIMLRRNSA